MNLTKKRKPFTRWIGRIDFLFAGLLFLLFLFNYTSLDERVLTVHDTFANFQNFYVFYNEFFFHQDLAHWYPYGTFGLQSDYNQLISLTPLSYLFGLAGWLLKIRDALLLFKLSVLGEQIAFLLGLYLLAGRIFKHRATVFLICLAAIGSTIWYAQLWFNFRFYYLMPLVLYGLISFFYEEKPQYLWYTGLAGVAWAVGNVPYFLPMWGFILLIITAALTLERSHVWRGLWKKTWANLFSFTAFLFLAGVYFYFALHSLDNIILDAPGRDPTTGKVSLETFRTYGGTADLYIVLQSFIAGWPLELPWGSGADNSVYIGLLPPVFLGAALVKERSRLFWGVAGGIIVLVWLSIGGLFTTGLYFIPLMSNYRHVGLMYGLVKLLALIAAGFGLDRFLSDQARKLPGGFVLVVAFIFLVESLLAMPEFFDRFREGNWEQIWRSVFVARVWVYVVLIGLSLAYQKGIVLALTLGLCFDLFTFQYVVYQSTIPKIPDHFRTMLDAVQVNELQYQAQRFSPMDRIIQSNPPDPEHERKLRALLLTENPGAMAIYWETYDFAQYDPCSSEYRSDFWTEGADRLKKFMQKRGVHFDAMIGCRSPKLRLISKAILVEDVVKAERAIRDLSSQEQDTAAVIRIIEGTQLPEGAGEAGAAAGDLRVTRFTTNEVVVDAQVALEGGAWLVYADAYHPGWKATVDGVTAPIEEAFLAFKAVWLPAGRHIVRFEFRNGLNYYLSYLIALSGVALGLIAGALVVKTLFFRVQVEDCYKRTYSNE